METVTDVRHKGSRNRRATDTLANSEDFIELTKDFQQLSSLYMIIYFCSEDWLECSGATVSRVLMMSLYRFSDTPFRYYIPIACGQ